MKLAIAAFITSLLFVGVAVGIVVFSNRDAIDAIKTETAERVDQSCRITERRYQAEVRRLEVTYRFLREHPDSELVAPILQDLPATEREVRLAHPPEFCAKPGVGVPHGRIPAVPVRPKFLR